MRAINFIILIFCVSLFSCESMEDTYGEFTEEGTPKHVGKVKDVTIEKGWNRLVFRWKNSIDPDVESVKVSWSIGEEFQEKILSSDKDTYATPADLGNFSYKCTVVSVNKEGKESLPETLYVRPYTKDHESIVGFGNIESERFFIGDKLILDLRKNLDFEKVEISYTSAGEIMKHELSQEDLDARFLVLDAVDKTKDVSVYRKINIPDCIDPIELDNYNIVENTTVSDAHFVYNLKRRYHLDKVDKEWMNSQEVLELDFDVNSFVHILNFPKLKTLKLGKNRFFQGVVRKPSVDDMVSSVYGINKAIELMGIEVIVSNDCFGIKDQLTAVTEEVPDMPVFVPHPDQSTFVYSWNNLEDEEREHFEYLYDQDVTTDWKPIDEDEDARTHEIIIDMQASKEISGVFISQSSYAGLNQNYRPEEVFISYSSDKMNWTDAYSVSVVQLGDAAGEKNFISFKEKLNTRYVRLMVKDRNAYGNKSIALSEFMVY